MVLEMAEKIEKEGAKFYKAAARRITTERIKNTLLEFADMEQEHEKRFASIRSELGEAEKRTGVSGLDPDIHKYKEAGGHHPRHPTDNGAGRNAVPADFYQGCPGR
jgi:rubrerythrin